MNVCLLWLLFMLQWCDLGVQIIWCWKWISSTWFRLKDNRFVIFHSVLLPVDSSDIRVHSLLLSLYLRKWLAWALSLTFFFIWWIQVFVRFVINYKLVRGLFFMRKYLDGRTPIVDGVYSFGWYAFLELALLRRTFVLKVFVYLIFLSLHGDWLGVTDLFGLFKNLYLFLFNIFELLDLRRSNIFLVGYVGLVKS